MANYHERRNCIDRICIGGVWGEEEDDIIGSFANNFGELLTILGDWRANIEGLNFSHLNFMDAKGLEEAFFEIEVLLTLRELNGDKGLGPDEFRIAFW